MSAPALPRYRMQQNENQHRFSVKQTISMFRYMAFDERSRNECVSEPHTRRDALKHFLHSKPCHVSGLLRQNTVTSPVARCEGRQNSDSSCGEIFSQTRSHSYFRVIRAYIQHRDVFKSTSHIREAYTGYIKYEQAAVISNRILIATTV